MTHFLFEGEWLRAVRMWQGGSDTAAIADKFECSEAMIYRELPHYRRKYPKINELYEAA